MEHISAKHWRCERDSDNIAWLTLDKKKESTNTIHLEILAELLSMIQSLQTGSIPLGLVIQSGKKNGFIAGADIKQFKDIETADAAFNLIQEGQMVFNHLAELPFPTVALIEGFCLGGGFELALACRYRIAIDNPKTKIGLPEVHLGIHPGWGGSVRLPRLIGGIQAMDLILSGRTLNAASAYKMGVVDIVVPKRQANAAAKYYLKNQPKRKTNQWLVKFSNLPYIRSLAGKWIGKKLAEKLNQAHYPAPFMALQHWVEQGVENDTAFMIEAKSVTQLMLTETARNLVRVFYLQEKLKDLGKEAIFSVNHVHVVGAGVMGGDIAAWCALKGFRVTLEDKNEKAIAMALNRALQLFNKHLKEAHLVMAAKDRLIADMEGGGVKKADLIIEAIIEKVEAKRTLFARLAKEAKPDALLATNTSTIPLAELSNDAALQERLIGLHFFNPVAKMPLVEVIVGDETAVEWANKGMAFVRLIDKLPLPVKSSPGFLVNRILMPYLMESILLLESGIPADAIDKAALEFGMPMGPIELADTVGLDVCLYAGESLSQYYGGVIPAKLRTLVEAGHLGRKTGQGFYAYEKDKKVKGVVDPNYRLPEDVIDRLMLSMINEAVACLREKVVTHPDYLDAGMIFGTGFPPFRGGPMHYVADQGESLLVQRLNLLAERYGKRFLADTGWTTLSIS